MMIRFSLATVRDRIGSFAGAFVALFAAAALVCGCLTLLATGLFGSVRPERYASAPIIIAGDQNVHAVKHKGNGKVKVKAKPVTDHVWVPESLARQIAALPSVQQVVTEVTFPAFLPGDRITNSWGHGWESAPLAGLTLESGRAPAAPGEVVLDASTARRRHLRVGSETAVRTSSGTMTVQVVGVTGRGFADQAALFFTADQARQLAGHPGLVSAIGVFPASGAAERDLRRLLAAAKTVPAAVVYTGDDRGAAEFADAETARIRLISMGGVLAGTALIVAVLVVVGTFGLSIQQRQREIAVLRAVAATGAQIRKMIGGEALLVGLTAGAGGAIAGLPMGAWLHREFVALGVIPANLPTVWSPFPAAAAGLATVIAAWAAARVSARRATAIRPVEALGEAELTPARVSLLRAVFGIAAAAGATVLTVLLTALHSDAAATPVCFMTALLWCTALALLGPIVARAAVAVLSGPLRLSRVAGFLAAQNLRATASRLASVVTPLTLLTAMAWTILFSHSTVAHASAEQRSAGIVANYVVGPRVPADVVAALRSTSGVETVTRVVRTQVRVGLTRRSVQAVTPEGLADTVELDVAAGDVSRLATGTAFAATGTGYRLGERVHLTLADGTPADVTVVALYRRGLGFGDLTLDHDLVAAHVDVPLDDEVLVRAPNLTRAALARAVHDDPGISILDRATAVAAPNDASAKIGYVSLGLIIAFTAIAVVNTLAMTITARTREFAALRRTGATKRQVMRMIGWETGVAVATATVFGVGIAVAVLAAYASGFTRGTAHVWAQPEVLATVTAGVVALAAVGAWVPARAALTRPS
jgi:putative ABC transport system permease protein